MDSIGGKIRKLRKEKGYSQECLAEKTGVSRQTIYKWENEEVLPNFANIQALAMALDVDINYFPDDSEGKEINVVAADISLNTQTDKLSDLAKEPTAETIRRIRGGANSKGYLIAAILSAVGFLIMLTVCVLMSFIVFTGNKGVYYENTSGTTMEQFVFCVILTAIFLILSIVFFVIYGKRRKSGK